MRWLLAVLLAPALGYAAEAPQDFAFAVPLEIDGREALYEVELPASVYQGVTRRDLGDLRVFNADGEQVPFALEPRVPQQKDKGPSIAVKVFPLYGERPADLDGLQLRVEKARSGTVVSVQSDSGKATTKRNLLAYLVDASTLERSYEALELDWRQDAASFATNLRVEASDDLRTWVPMVSQAPLVRIDYGGERLEQRSVEFQPRNAKYLRLSWPAADQPLEITRALVRTSETPQEPARAWKEAQASAGEQTGDYVFDLGGQFPVERVRVELPQDNTIARVELLSRQNTSQQWRSVTSAVAYRLRQQGQQVVSPDIAVGVNGDRYWLLRVDQKGGGLGTGMPKLNVGWMPVKLVFAARGKAPFQIAYGSGGVQRAAYPIETLVPGWRTQSQVALAQAHTLPERLLGGPDVVRPKRNYKVWALWTALDAGVILLAWMAWRLSRQMRSTDPAPQKKESAAG